ncbi:hypothetical protein EDD22DRAFT_853847 [Suillus occidentalis]|nr:hypothetical protein EDD22DRAFT_853847 [Suillus occidentalis]
MEDDSESDDGGADNDAYDAVVNDGSDDSGREFSDEESGSDSEFEDDVENQYRNLYLNFLAGVAMMASLLTFANSKATVRCCNDSDKELYRLEPDYIVSIGRKWN